MASSDSKPRLALYESQVAFNRRKNNPLVRILAEIPDPLFRDALLREREPIAELLKGLSQAPRDDGDLLSLSEALNFIQLFLIYHRSPEDPDHAIFRQFDEHARKELDKLHKKTAELITNIRASFTLSDDSPLCSLDVGLEAPTIAEGTLAALEKFVELVAAKRERLMQKTGPKTAREFVQAIIQIVEEYTGDKVERTNNRIVGGTPLDVVHKIVAMMDPEIGSGTIDGAIKALPNARGEIKRRKR